MKTVVILLSCVSLIAADKANLRKFTSGNVAFAADIYKQVSAESNENFLVCPFSAETVLALVQSGAKGETRKELRTALHLSQSSEKIENVFRSLLPSLSGGKHYSLHAANKIYVKEGYAIKDDFKKTAADVYQSSVENINFSEKVQAAKTINDWVEKQTENRIHDLVPEDSLTEDTVVILINALYFKGAWSQPFRRYLTLKRDFYKSAGDVIQVDTMRNRDLHGYYESSELNATFLKLSFNKSKKVQMVIVLPNERNGLAALENQIDKVLTAPKFTSKDVNVALPKFTIESSIDFKKILKNAGVKKAFDHADFSGITGKSGQIYISDILQKTFISVDEGGVEAAAATAVHLHGKSLIDYFGGEKSFVADHPFLFYIKIKNIVVFTGRVTSPA
ncbi:Serpin domain containing protein [Asbolus verrucosus]|uniref:Serpin domain containing protein n=1 Tax=Asbolus verrucosus TaxID=1661398 RepID=A0A482VQW1_ASBVE|nr:Serpin domain containing protein [Asbolus verrucosus]